MNVLATALAGGADGSLLTIATGAGSRIAAVPDEIRANDRRAHDRDVDLERWVTDESVRLRRDLAQTREALNAKNLFHSGAYGVQLGFLKEEALQAYRDQEAQALRDVAAIFDRETWMHTVARHVKGEPRYELETPRRAKPLLDVWRAPLVRHLNITDPPKEISDPTARTLSEEVEAVATAPLDFQ